MGSCNVGHYESIKTALEGVGLKVDKIQKNGRKTVINTIRCEASKNFNTGTQLIVHESEEVCEKLLF